MFNSPPIIAQPLVQRMKRTCEEKNLLFWSGHLIYMVESTGLRGTVRVPSSDDMRALLKYWKETKTSDEEKKGKALRIRMVVLFW